jgi:hypothetical protein
MNYINTELVTYDPDQVGTDLEKLRLAIGDTETGNGVRPDARNFSNGELSAFIATAGDWQSAIALAVQTLATEYANAGRRALLSANPEMVKTADQYAKVAAELRLQAASWENRLAAIAAEVVSSDPAIAYAGNDSSTAFFQLPPNGVI